jgi:hypothetical protein
MTDVFLDGQKTVYDKRDLGQTNEQYTIAAPFQLIARAPIFKRLWSTGINFKE